MKWLKLTVMLGVSLVLILLQQSTPVSSQSNELFNMSYMFIGSPTTYTGQVDKTNGSVDVVSPDYFDINENGDLVVTWKLLGSFIDSMHNRGIRVVPFLSNHWKSVNGIKGLENRERLAQQVAAAIDKHQLDGVNVDIEGVGHAYREEHTDFVRLLREYIPDHKEVSVAVAANPNSWKTGWHGFYDYKALSNYADYLMIMAYDESWDAPDSPVGPVSSIQFFERSIQYALNQGVSKDRIVIGLPFYGRMWKKDGYTLDNKRITGMGVSSTRIEPLVNKFGGSINFDVNTQSSYAKFTIPKNEEAFIGSTRLTEGDYTIWYDNEPAIKAKLRLPKQYGIKGTGSWALGHETADTWSYYASWLNADYFADVTSSYWAEASIKQMAEKGWMNGTSDMMFSPKKTLTRAEGAVIIVRALGYSGVTPKAREFTDTSNHWARTEIELARELGFLSGTSESKFSPNSPLTREQLATILNNVFQFPSTADTTNSFPDVTSNRWSYIPIMSLSQQGYIGGYPDGTFRPKQSSNRAEMATLMDRMTQQFEQKRNE